MTKGKNAYRATVDYEYMGFYTPSFCIRGWRCSSEMREKEGECVGEREGARERKMNCASGSFIWKFGRTCTDGYDMNAYTHPFSCVCACVKSFHRFVERRKESYHIKVVQKKLFFTCE